MRLIASVPFYLAGAILTCYAVIIALKAILDTVNGNSLQGTMLMVLAIILAVLGTGLWKLAPRIRGTNRPNAL